ncbi:MAG: ATP-binding protein [Candidatus Humimicrobiaceae bacterium]
MQIERIIKLIDFWNNTITAGNLKDRVVLNTINLKTNEIIDITGPRRSGKSSVLKMIIKKLKLKDNYIFMNFEDPFFIDNSNPEIIDEIISVFKQHFNPQLKYLFFDEIQEINQWERIINKYRELNELKMFITGSNSKFTESELASLLTGRHLSYKVMPLNFTEFIYFNGIKINSLKEVVLNKKTILDLFDKHMQIGGFPEIVITENMELAKTYFTDILYKDIVMRHDIRQKTVLEKIALFFISNSGKIISIESLKNNYNISFEMSSSYIDYLKSAFLILELNQFSYSLKKQQKSLKKYYSIDTGIANSISFRFSEDKGRMLENIVFLHLKNSGSNIYYYKTRNNLEVDFLIADNMEIKDLIQVSWNIENSETRAREIKSLAAAMEELNINSSKIITYDQEEEIRVGSKTIHVIPAFKWFTGIY